MAQLVTEKDSGLRQAMRTMGLMESSYWSSWIVFDLVFGTLLALAIVFSGAGVRQISQMQQLSAQLQAAAAVPGRQWRSAGSASRQPAVNMQAAPRVLCSRASRQSPTPSPLPSLPHAGMILRFRFFLANDFQLLFALFWLFLAAISGFVYFVSAFVRKPQTAVYVGFLVFLVSRAPQPTPRNRHRARAPADPAAQPCSG